MKGETNQRIMFGETYTKMENGNLEEYWCSTNKKIGIPAPHLFCEESKLRVFYNTYYLHPTIVIPMNSTVRFTYPFSDFVSRVFYCDKA
jgi:hypothetical protein